MKKCLQNTMVKQPKKDLGNTVLTLRLTEAEALRFWTLMDVVKKRNPYAGKSDVIRELLELTDTDLLTVDDIAYFRTGQKKAAYGSNSEQGGANNKNIRTSSQQIVSNVREIPYEEIEDSGITIQSEIPDAKKRQKIS